VLIQGVVLALIIAIPLIGGLSHGLWLARILRVPPNLVGHTNDASRLAYVGTGETAIGHEGP
jgi:hypothetical protein